MSDEMNDVERLALLREKRARIVELRQQIRDQLQDHQKPPETNWLVWVLLAGRGAGKTYGGMFWLNDYCSNNPGTRARIIAPTQSDAVASCVEGPNGLLTLSHGVARFNPSHASGANVSYPNKSRVWIVGTNAPKDVDRLRALTNIEIDVFEEAFANPQLQAAWDQAEFSRRKGKRLCVVTSTPRPHPIHKEWVADPDVVISHAKTSDNKKNDPKWVARQERKYKGTRWYKQEFLGEVLDDIEGALWKQADIERSYATAKAQYPDRAALVAACEKIAVGVDPPRGSGTCGIVVVGRTPDKRLWVLQDYSLTDVTAGRWARQVDIAAADYGAMVVVEVNMGGRMVTEVLAGANINLPTHEVNAAQSKEARAEPFALRWEADEQSAFFYPPEDLDDILLLTDQLTTWIPKTGMASPDRLDGMVWACKYLDAGDEHLEATFPTPTYEEDRMPTSMAAAMRGGY